MIYTRGDGPVVSTKVLWLARRPGQWLVVSGRRLDAAGSFSERWRTVGSGQFPSIVVVPDPGCWRLSLRTGSTHAAVVVNAIDD